MDRRRIARKAIELVKIRGDMFEKQDKFMIRFNGKDWGKLYFNMRGYVAERGIPVPTDEDNPKPIGLDIGEKGLSAFKREISKANREWAAMDRQRISAKKYKVGDPIMYDGRKGEVTKVQSGGRYTIKLDDGAEFRNTGELDPRFGAKSKADTRKREKQLSKALRGSMDRHAIATELVAIAKELTARAPKMKMRWKDIGVGDTFKWKRKKFRKIGPNSAIDVKDIQMFRDDVDYKYERG